MTATVVMNYRDNQTLALLTDIQHENGSLFRDHCWIKPEELTGFIPHSNSYKLRIEFTAQPLYYTRNGQQKTTLQQLKDIKVIEILRNRKQKAKSA